MFYVIKIIQVFPFCCPLLTFVIRFIIIIIRIKPVALASV
jgi:hypothetical protein